MVENELSQQHSRKRTKQPISVPFLWEEKPGTPKRDWKLTPHQIPVVTHTPPVKLEASVPFLWEEKPGKPLPRFLEPQSESAISVSPTELLALPWHPSYSQQNNDDHHDDSDDDADDADDEQDGIFESDHDELWSFETDESFRSIPSLLANRLVQSAAISGAVPVQQTYQRDDHSGHLETPSSPASEAESSTSSYATGTTSLIGAPFLECLFPLLQPDSGFLTKVGSSENSSRAPPEVASKDFDTASNCSVVIRRPPTLGELIMMSRRRSYQRKAVQMRKQNLSMEFMKKTAFGCGIFGTGNRIGGLHRTWKRQLRLKLV